MNIPVLRDDDTFVVINKPSGIVVNRARTVKEPTVQDWSHERHHISDLPPDSMKPDEEGNLPREAYFYLRGGIVHRLDRETSGAMIIAKTSEAYVTLQAQFAQRTVEKEYIALVHGVMSPPEGSISVPVGRLPWDKKKFGIVPEGKPAHTLYRVLSSGEQRFGKKIVPVSLVHFFPKTGRTHQIRVHAKYINHPIVGDYHYAGRKTARDDRMWVSRVMLHAYRLSFDHPLTGDMISVTAPLPQSFTEPIVDLVSKSGLEM